MTRIVRIPTPEDVVAAREVIARHLEVTPVVRSPALRFLVREHGLIVEGSGVVGVAALLNGHVPLDDGATAVLLTGRNITASVLSELLG